MGLLQENLAFAPLSKALTALQDDGQLFAGRFVLLAREHMGAEALVRWATDVEGIEPYVIKYASLYVIKRIQQCITPTPSHI